ncbi:MAG TPA: hypothetical protein VFZ65_11600 [Planctomycetota bacterium]|nr:hypothetical protein [Planctomycetota bacterium]
MRDDGNFVIELPGGDWHGRVGVKNHPEIRFAPGALEGGAVWDAGVLQLTVGGTLVVRGDGGTGKLEYYVLDARERFVCSLYTPVPPLRSELLAPGDYLLLGHSEGLAAQAMPFTIRPGNETELVVPRQPGVRQWIEFVVAAGTDPPPWVEFDVRRDATLLASLSVGKSLRRALWLAPGSYTLTTRNRAPKATVTFTVGSTEGPPLRVALR